MGIITSWIPYDDALILSPLDHWNESIDYLTSQPPDILLEIARHLDYRDVVRLCQTARIFDDLFGKENFGNLWKHLYFRDVSREWISYDQDYQMDYQRDYRKDYQRWIVSQRSRQVYYKWCKPYLNEF
jgi:hypothetical protein